MTSSVAARPFLLGLAFRAVPAPWRMQVSAVSMHAVASLRRLRSGGALPDAEELRARGAWRLRRLRVPFTLPVDLADPAAFEAFRSPARPRLLLSCHTVHNVFLVAALNQHGARITAIQHPDLFEASGQPETEPVLWVEPGLLLRVVRRLRENECVAALLDWRPEGESRTRRVTTTSGERLYSTALPELANAQNVEVWMGWVVAGSGGRWQVHVAPATHFGPPGDPVACYEAFLRAHA